MSDQHDSDCRCEACEAEGDALLAAIRAMPKEQRKCIIMPVKLSFNGSNHDTSHFMGKLGHLCMLWAVRFEPIIPKTKEDKIALMRMIDATGEAGTYTIPSTMMGR